MDSSSTLQKRKLTPNLLLDSASALSASLDKGRDAAAVLGSVTQLALDRKHLGDLDGIQVCKNLRALFVEQNGISSLQPIGELYHIETIVADENELTDLRGVVSPELTQLSVNHNRLRSIDGLAACAQLSELSVAYQRSPDACGLIRLHFEPSTLTALCSLQFLDIRGNGIVDIAPLSALRRLRKLDMSDNCIASIAAVTLCASSWPELEWCDTRGNPCAVEQSGRGHVRYSVKYRDAVIAASASATAAKCSSSRLCWFDGQEISPLQTAFISKLQARRRSRGSAAAAATSDEEEETHAKALAASHHLSNGRYSGASCSSGLEMPMIEQHRQAAPLQKLQHARAGKVAGGRSSMVALAVTASDNSNSSGSSTGMREPTTTSWERLATQSPAIESNQIHLARSGIREGISDPSDAAPVPTRTPEDFLPSR